MKLSEDVIVIGGAALLLYYLFNKAKSVVTDAGQNVHEAIIKFNESHGFYPPDTYTNASMTRPIDVGTNVHTETCASYFAAGRYLDAATYCSDTDYASESAKRFKELFTGW